MAWLGAGLGAVMLLAAASASAQGSRHVVLAERQALAEAPVDVVATTVELPRAGWAYVHADGGLLPLGNAIANAWISVDGRQVSNESVVDWRGSRAPNRRAFNAIGAIRLPAGRSRIALRARAIGPAAVTAGSSLSVLLDPADEVRSRRLATHSPWLAFDTRNTPEGRPLPRGRGWQPVVSIAAGNSGGPLVAMASGRAYAGNQPGDAMWGLFLNGREPPLHSATWSINDLFREGAEIQAPMFAQALFPSARSGSTVQLVASESPYYTPRMASTNHVRYRVGAGTTLVTLAGGMAVVGRGYSPRHDYVTRGRNRRYAYVCIGTNGFRPPERCPPMGTEVVLGRGLACVPAGHDGEVFFSSRTRIQGDDHDEGGTVTLALRVDGREVARNVQALGPRPHAVSTRTIGTSWLSAGDEALAPGCHVVEAVARAEGDFRNISLNPDLPLLWFD